MLTAAVAPSSTKIVLVDPARQQKEVNENDPQKVVNKAIEGHEKVTKKELDASVERAFSAERCGQVCGDILKDSKRTASTTPSV